MDVPTELVVLIRTDGGSERAHMRSSLDGPSLCGIPLFVGDAVPTDDSLWKVADGSACGPCLNRLGLLVEVPALLARWREGELQPEELSGLAGLD